MSKFSAALGPRYEENRMSIMTRTFALGDHTFKVKVPSVGEMEIMNDKLKNPDQEEIDLVYKELTADIEVLRNELNSDVRFEKDDIFIGDRSMKEAAKNKVVVKYRITQYMKLIVPDSGASLDDLTYQDIEDEFPFAIQMQFMDKILEVLSPSYKEIREK